MASIPFSSWALLSLLAVLTNLAFLIFVLLKNPHSETNRAWSLAILCLLVWGSGQFIMRITSEYATAEIVQKISGVGFCLLPSPFLHFAVAFTGQKRWLRQRWFYLVLYAPGIIFAFLETQGYITKTIRLSSGFVSDPHIGYGVYILWLEIYFLGGLYLCYRKWRNATSSRERNQASFVIFGVAVPLLIGSVTDALLPMLGIETPRSAVVATTATAAFVAYAVIKFQLMSLTPQTAAGAILNTIVDLLAVTDREGQVIFTNESFRKIISLRNERTPLLHIKNFIEEGNDVLAAAKHLYSTPDKSRLMEVRYKTPRGAPFPVLLSISPIFDRGESLGFVFVARDITGRKQAEAALMESEERYRTLVETVTDAIIMIDEESKILSINTAAEKIFGYAVAEMIGQELTKLMPEHLRPLHKAAVKRYIATGEKRFAWDCIQLPGLRKSGEIIPLEISFGEFIKGGRRIFTGIVRDITERKKLEEAARQRAEDLQNFAVSVQRAQEEERRRIARELHDDLGQRLTGVKLNIEVLEDEIPKASRKTGKKLKEIKRQIDLMITEIRRISSNLRPTALDDFGLVIALQLLCKEFQKVQNLRVRFEHAAAERYHEHVEIALYRIAQEALSNIARHAEATSVSVQLLDRGNAVTLTIEDDGKGFEAEKNRPKSPLKGPSGLLSRPKGSGRGLGCISMKERAELLGGTFQLESSPKKGTRIHVTIPLKSSQENEKNQNPDRR